MKKINKILFIFSASLFFLGSFSLTSDAGFFKYVDKQGTIHFTDSYESIPEQYRNQVEMMKEPAPQTPSQPAEAGEGAAKGAGVRKDEVQKDAREIEAMKKKEAELKAAQEKERLEKEALEQKLKAREEKEQQIEELRRQIEAKQQEQRTLYNNPMMVRDRNQFTQLNQEINDIYKQIQGLQSELDAQK